MQRHALFIGNAHLLLATASVCITPFTLSCTVIDEFDMKSHDLHLLNLILLGLVFFLYSVWYYALLSWISKLGSVNIYPLTSSCLSVDSFLSHIFVESSLAAFITSYLCLFVVVFPSGTTKLGLNIRFSCKIRVLVSFNWWSNEKAKQHVAETYKMYFSDSPQGRPINSPSPPSLCQRRPLLAPILLRTLVNKTGRRNSQCCLRDRRSPMLNPTSAMEASTPWPYWEGRCSSSR